MLLLLLVNPIMLIVYLLIFAIVVGLGYLIINRLIPDGTIRTWVWVIFLVIVAIFLISYVLLPLAGGIGSVMR
jgi:hypothetical protein